ncbi:MAG: hypothetical protein Q8Q01_03085 [archaeon]|nr:hypothetical protein [archaeon]
MKTNWNKKGMGIGQVFVFIIMALTFALITIFGYKAIAGFLEKGEEVAFVQFKNDLEIAIKQINTEFGAYRLEDFRPPRQSEKICFVNMDYGKESGGNIDGVITGLTKEMPTAVGVYQDAIENQGYTSAEENVFLQPEAPVKIKVHRIELFDSGNEVAFLCPPIKGGVFHLGLEGRGDRTRLTVPMLIS